MIRLPLAFALAAMVAVAVALPAANAAPLQVAQAEPAAETARPAETPRPTQEQVARTQQALTDLGYDPGPVDGFMGPATAAAIRAYQKSIGVEETGQVSEPLLAALEESAAAGQDNGNGAAAGSATPEPSTPEPAAVEITDDPSTYDLGDLSDLNTFD